VRPGQIQGGWSIRICAGAKARRMSSIRRGARGRAGKDLGCAAVSGAGDAHRVHGGGFHTCEADSSAAVWPTFKHNGRRLAFKTSWSKA